MESLIALGANIVLYAFLAWVLFFALQLSDLFASLVDMRGAHDDRLKRRPAGPRVTEYFWSIPIVFTLVLAFALGIDYAGRLLFDQSRLRDGLIVVSLLLFAAFAVGIAIVYALGRVDSLSYSALRANLQEEAELRPARARVEAFRAQLEEIDAKQRHIRLGVRDRARLPRTRAELRNIADSFRAVPPSGLRPMSAIRWKFAWAYLWRGNALRVVPPLLALMTTVVAVLVLLLSQDWSTWWTVFFLGIAFAVSALLSLTSARAALASKTAWHAAYLKQRTEVEDLLIELEKSSRKGVAGLGDRVARALQILREQQE